MASNSPVPADKILTEARSTLAQRSPDYDKQGDRYMAHAVEVFNTIKQWEPGQLSERDGWMFMLCVKIARSQVNPTKLDNYVDASVYAALLGECSIKLKSQAVSNEATSRT